MLASEPNPLLLSIVTGDVGFLVKKFLSFKDLLKLYSTCKDLYFSSNRRHLISQNWIKIQRFPLTSVQQYDIQFVEVNLSWLPRLAGLRLPLTGIKIEDEYLPEYEDNDKKRYSQLLLFRSVKHLHINNAYGNNFDFLKQMDLHVFVLTPDRSDMPDKEQCFTLNHLSHMKDLRKVEFTFCKLRGKFEWKCRQLEFLNFHCCSIPSFSFLKGIPVRNVAVTGGRVVLNELMAIQQVETLILNNIGSKNFFDSFGNFTNLKKLEISYNGSAPLDALGLAQVPNIDYFSSVGNKFTNLDVLSDLTKIHTFELNETKIDNLQFISSLVNIRELWLNSAKLKDITPLAALKKVQFMELNNNEKVFF